MNRATLILRTFAWAAVGFLVTNGAVLALADAVSSNEYATGVKALVLSLIAAALSGLVACLKITRVAGDTPLAKGVNQAIQMLIAGAATLVLADLTDAAAVAFGVAAFKLVAAAVLGGVQATLVNYAQEQPPSP